MPFRRLVFRGTSDMDDTATKPQVGDTWYRVQDTRYGSIDEYGDVVHVRVELTHTEYKVVKVTPKGVWLSFGFGGKDRFVLLGARKRFAHPTKEAALESLVARKERQTRILKKQLDQVQTALFIAQSQLAKLKPKSEPAGQEAELLDLV